MDIRSKHQVKSQIARSLLSNVAATEILSRIVLWSLTCDRVPLKLWVLCLKAQEALDPRLRQRSDRKKDSGDYSSICFGICYPCFCQKCRLDYRSAMTFAEQFDEPWWSLTTHNQSFKNYGKHPEMTISGSRLDKATVILHSTMPTFKSGGVFMPTMVPFSTSFLGACLGLRPWHRELSMLLRCNKTTPLLFASNRTASLHVYEVKVCCMPRNAFI